MKYCNRNETCQWIANTYYPNIKNEKNEIISDINKNLNESKLLMEKFVTDENNLEDYLGIKFNEEVTELSKELNTLTDDINTYSSNLDNEISNAINNHYSHYHSYLESLKSMQDDEIKEDAME